MGRHSKPEPEIVRHGPVEYDANGYHRQHMPADDQPTQQVTAPAPAAYPPVHVRGRMPVSTFGTGLTIRQRKTRDNVRDGVIALVILAAGLVGIWLVVLGMTP